MIPLFKDGGQGGQQINRALGGSKILFLCDILVLKRQNNYFETHLTVYFIKKRLYASVSKMSVVATKYIMAIVKYPFFLFPHTSRTLDHPILRPKFSPFPNAKMYVFL